MKCVYFYQMKIGQVGIAEVNNKISNLYLNIDNLNEELIIHESFIIRKAHQQLCEYLDGQRKEFELDYHLEGTEFRKSVWNKLLEIPCGKTISYQQLAKEVGKEKACRAVGNANGKNPIPIFIPCHRVISSNGSLGGYSLGLDLKQMLLDLEREN